MGFNGATFGATNGKLNAIASGFQDAESTGLNTFDVVFANGKRIPITIPNVTDEKIGSEILKAVQAKRGELSAVWNGNTKPTDPSYKVWIRPSGGTSAETYVKGIVSTELNTAKANLVPKDGIKTINGQSILGSGNIVIEGGGTSTSNEEFPSYLTEEYNTTKASVENVSTNNSFNILCATDLHFSPKGSGYNENKLRTPLFNMFKAFRRAEKEIPMSLVALLGDYMQVPTPNTKEQGISNLAEINTELSGMTTPTMAICGNHEYNYKGDGTGFGLNNDECCRMLLKKYVGRDIRKASDNVFYMLDDANEVCYLFISADNNAVINTYLRAAFDSVMAKNINNYPYIIFSHFSVDTVNNTVWSGVGNAIDYIKTTKGKSIIAWIGGHKHSDWVVNYNDTLVICLINSGFYTNEACQDGVTYSKNLGTPSESAFSILTFDKTVGKLYVTRFGAGVDFECNYNTTSGSIGESEEVEPQNYWFNIDTATISQYLRSTPCEYTCQNGNVVMSIPALNTGLKFNNTLTSLPTKEKGNVVLIADSGEGEDLPHSCTLDFYKGTTKVGSAAFISSGYSSKFSDIFNGGIKRYLGAATIEAIAEADNATLNIRASSKSEDIDASKFPIHISFVNLRIELE